MLRTHVYVDDECRIWAGALQGGYPSHWWAGKRRQARHTLLALAGRPLADGHQVWSTCGNPLCMAEAHLRAGTRRQALQAAAKRGAYPRGVPRTLISAMARAKTARMPVTEAHAVAAMLASGSTIKAIGDRYGVTRSAASIAIKRWSRAGLLPMFVPMQEAS